MADLSTSWLGLDLSCPLVVSASPLSRDADAIAAAVAAGAGAVVMYSLFEEQLVSEQLAANRFFDARLDADAEARTFMPDVDVFSLDAEPYVRQLERLRARVAVPIVASLNGTTPGGWTSYARQLEAAGASALELNLYEVATSADETGAALEARQLEVVAAVVATVAIPVTVKLSPFYSSLPAFVRRLAQAGARGVTVFNRFYQPDLDLEELDVDRRLVASTSSELPLRLHALAVLAPTTPLALGCTGGVHSGTDAAKAILCGAHVLQLASALLVNGPAYVGVIRDELLAWLDGKGYRSSAEARGVMDARSSPDPHAWARLNYARMLDSWRERPRSA
ncbi:MAG: dihydroorotate dehydrogenase-like protein [Myxococcales bacterium]|nr:dihydroorotate dehydrogenase-like protein [Myxococcales bacterium]